MYSLLRVAFVPLLCFFLLVASGFADDSDWIKKLLAEQDRKNAIESAQKAGEEIGRNMREAARLKADFNERIAAARKQFWATYPDKPGAVQARTTFADLLRQKDLYFMQNTLTFATDERTRAQRDPKAAAPIFKTLELATGGRVDGGIRQSAKPEFYDWVDAVRRNLQAQGMHQLNSLNDLFSYATREPGRIVTAVNKSQSEFEIYLAERDWAEFDLAGKEPAGSDNPHVYGALLLMRFEKLSWTIAKDDYATMAALMGASLTESVDKKIHGALKNGERYITDVASLGVESAHEADLRTLMTKGMTPAQSSYPTDVMAAMLGCCDTRRYLLTLLAADGPRGKSYDWQYAATAYKRWSLALGEPEVLKAAEAVRTAPKRAYDADVYNPQQIGAMRAVPYSTFQDILVRNNPRGYVRAVLSFNENLDTAAAIDAAYQKLVSSYGDKLEETATKLAGRTGALSQYPHVTAPSEMKTMMGMLSGTLEFAGQKDVKVPATAATGVVDAVPCATAAPPAARGKKAAAAPTIVARNTPCPTQSPETVAKVDSRSQAPEPVSMEERTMGENYGRYRAALRSWQTYQTSHRDLDLKEALLEKRLVWVAYEKSCAQIVVDNGENGKRSTSCTLLAQVKDGLKDIKEDGIKALANSTATRVGSSPSGAAGIYVGHYVCGLRRPGLELDLRIKDDGLLSGVFTAFWPNEQPMAFSFTGHYDSAKSTFRATPSKWETQAPRGYQMVGFNGAYDSASQQMRGKIEFPSCGEFTVNRTSRK
jgi:hypothetical protein